MEIHRVEQEKGKGRRRKGGDEIGRAMQQAPALKHADHEEGPHGGRARPRRVDIQPEDETTTIAATGRGHLESARRACRANATTPSASPLIANRCMVPASVSVQDNAGNLYEFYASEVNLGYTTLTITGVTPVHPGVPANFVLGQNYPNPFNPATIIRYELPAEAFVHLSVFNVLGQEVRVLVNQKEQAGARSVQFDGSAMPSGVYFVRMMAGPFAETKKMVLLR